MPAPYTTLVVIDRANFQQLVAGKEVVFHAPARQIRVRLDLDRPGAPRWTDPPEAAEYYAKPKGGTK